MMLFNWLLRNDGENCIASITVIHFLIFDINNMKDYEINVICYLNISFLFLLKIYTNIFTSFKAFKKKI